MTFIASVVAQDGIAIVTTEEYSMSWESFRKLAKEKGGNPMSENEIKGLFVLKPSYTRNYTEKLFKFGTHSAITTAGHAFINHKPIKEIIEAANHEAEKMDGYPNNDINDIIKKVIEILNREATGHINEYGFIGQTSFVFSHFNIQLHKPQIFKIKVAETTKSALDEAVAKGNTHTFITYADETGFGYVTDGQDAMIDRLLFGSLYKFHWLPGYITRTMVKDLKFKKKTRDKIADYIEKSTLMKDLIDEEINYIERRPLSLQEAVDYAALLVRIVINIQSYTKKIPTVGGVIKLGVIDCYGFKQIAGHEIVKPTLIY